jgi:hypothetical protein
MAALPNGVMDVIDPILSSPPPPTTTTMEDGDTTPRFALLDQVATTAAAFVESGIPARNAQLQEAAVQALLALMPPHPPPSEEQEEASPLPFRPLPFTVVTISLSSTLMAVLGALRAREPARPMRVVRVSVCVRVCVCVYGWVVGGWGRSLRTVRQCMIECM